MFKEANWLNVFVDTRIPCNAAGEVNKKMLINSFVAIFVATTRTFTAVFFLMFVDGAYSRNERQR